ncbi:MAG: ABC transporter permease, partial [Acetobacteraceae bacterium]|nr:ABC transporter permease [Acetobacteraceae bacterium]
MPIDPVIAIVGDHAPPDVMQAVRDQLGLDKPLTTQFWIYLGHLARGDMGRSVMTSHAVTEDIVQYFPATIELATTAIVLATLIGVPLGVLAAVKQRTKIDHAIRVFCLAGHSIPIFLLALLSLLIFYAQLGWAPGTGRQDVAFEGMDPTVTGFLLFDTLWAGDWDAFRDALGHLAQPAGVLAYFSMAYIARMTRGFMLDALSGEFV